MRKTILWLFWALALITALTALIVTSRPAQAEPASADLVETPPVLALTFDDGPAPITTTALLDGLGDRGVPATFFVLGAQAERYPDLIRRMADEGHQVGLHTYDHVSLRGESPDTIRAQLDACRAALTPILGEQSFPVRPPYGFYDATVQAEAQAPLILWSLDTLDWEKQDPVHVVDTILTQAQDGDIVLLHDIYPDTVDGVLQAIDALQARGWQFVTVADLFALRGVAPVNGELYRALPPTSQRFPQNP